MKLRHPQNNINDQKISITNFAGTGRFAHIYLEDLERLEKALENSMEGGRSRTYVKHYCHLQVMVTLYLVINAYCIMVVL